MCSLMGYEAGFWLELDNQQIISVEDLNLVLNAFYHMDEGISLNNSKVMIIPKNPFERVNIVFVAGLILLQKTFNCNISLNYDQISDRNRICELLQINNQNKILHPRQELYQINYLSSNPLHIPKKQQFSRSFAPVFHIDNNNYLLLFDNKTYNDANNNIKEGIKDILKNYLDKVNELNEEKIFSDELEKFSHSPFFLFVFSILYFKIEPYKKKVQKGYEKTKEQLIESIFLFVQDYSDGIYELAKNIIEHSDRKEGIITVRVYDDDEGDGNILENYVFDFGSRGIIETIKLDTHDLLCRQLDETLREDLNGDLSIINSNGYSLTDFVEPLVNRSSQKQILNQQIRREIAHFGLMQFLNLITSNDGYISMGTENCNHSIDRYSSNQTPSVNTHLHNLSKGTSFFFQFPPNSIVGNEVRAIPVDKQEKQISSLEIDSFASFYAKYEDTVTITLDGQPARGREYEQKIINDFVCQLNGQESSPEFIAVDFRNINGLSPAGFLRILASIPLKTKGKHIIISNIPSDLYLKAIENNQLYYNRIQKQWWIENNQVLCYSYVKVSDGRNYYYADLLGGKDKAEFTTINRIIHNTFDNALTIVNKDESADCPDGASNNKNPFFTENALTPFDIEVKSKSGKSVFINNLELILNNEIDRTANNTERVEDISLSDIDILHRHFDRICGYSISNTHFKIGSKIHAKRYIYAKRLFNNSYYSSRLALCLAHMISQEDVAKDKTKSLSLLGYEQYSLAMLGLVKKYLENWGYKKLSVCHAYTDDGKLKIKGPFDYSGDYIIVVPIVSTGSTSIAMKQAVNKDPVLYYHIVVTESGNKDYPADEFTAEERTKIKKIIGIVTDWNETKNCPYCFEGERKPLLEADKTNLNPLSIFNFPTTKKVSESVKFDLKAFEGEGILKYSVGKKPNGYYRLYSINSDSFINKNLEDVTGWLNNLRDKLQWNVPEDTRIHPTDHIVLLAPSSDTNTRFVNIVNEYVFGSSATILYLQADEEYLENFKLLNIGLFQNINSTKVFFVDDELVSGSVFFKIHDLFRFTTKYEDRILGSIFLLNKASEQIDTRVKRASSGSLYAYMAVNDQSLFDLSGLSPLDSEYRKYESLASHSLNIDSRIYFQKKASSFKITDSNSNEERHLCMFGIIHSLYEYFGKFEGTKKVEEFQAINDIGDLCIKIGHKAEEKYELIKVLCNHPFVMYYDILCKTFELQNKMLMDEVKDIDAEITELKIKHILFLIRRAVLIKNYVVISSEFFKNLSILFDAVWEKQSKSSENQNAADVFNQEDFSGMAYYLVRRYAEIVNQNGWCAKHISDNIKNVEFRTEQGKLFKSLLLIEISSVMNNYYDTLEKQPKWRDFPVIKPDNSFKTVIEIKTGRVEIDRTLTLNDSNTRDMALSLVHDNKTASFDTFVWLKKFLTDDKNGKLADLSLSQKIDAICDHIKELFTGTRVGVLFVVVDNRDKYHIVYDRDGDNCNRFTDSYNFNKDDSNDLFAKLLPECNKESESGFKDSGNKSLFFDKDEEYNRMTLRVYHNDNLKPVCFLSIYDKNVVFSDDIDAQRLLSLVSSDLDFFVVRHHKNDEFISLVEAESEKRLSYLMGHGRNTIKRLSEERPELFQDMLDIQEYLQFQYYRKIEEWPFKPKSFDDELFKSLIVDIKEFVNKIYASKNVEYEVCLFDDSNVLVDSNSKEQIPGFSFNARLLKYICFELIINAKKTGIFFKKD